MKKMRNITKDKIVITVAKIVVAAIAGAVIYGIIKFIF